MKILGIDTSCDESCVAILDTEKQKLLADVVHSHVDATKRFGGIVPEIVSREHVKAIALAYLEAMEASKCEPKDIDWIAVTSRPGLIGSLLVGISFAKALAFALKKPFSCLSHIEAHVYSPLLAKLENTEVPPFPWIDLVVSGGHTELFLVRSDADFEWLGGTMDDAAGEAFDKIGKILGFSYPAGPEMDRLVAELATDKDRRAIKLPRAKVPGFQFSFSGLKTAVNLKTRALTQFHAEDRLSFAASAQEAILDALIEKVDFACKKFGVSQVVVTGGVARNSRLRTKLADRAYFPHPRHCSDNAAMVALLASLHAKHGKLEPAAWNTSPPTTYSML